MDVGTIIDILSLLMFIVLTVVGFIISGIVRKTGKSSQRYEKAMDELKRAYNENREALIARVNSIEADTKAANQKLDQIEAINARLRVVENLFHKCKEGGAEYRTYSEKHFTTTEEFTVALSELRMEIRELRDKVCILIGERKSNATNGNH